MSNILEEALKEAKARKTILRRKLLKHIIQLIISIIGASIIIYKEGWLLFLGLLIFMWGNNLMIRNKE